MNNLKIASSKLHMQKLERLKALSQPIEKKIAQNKTKTSQITSEKLTEEKANFLKTSLENIGKEIEKNPDNIKLRIYYNSLKELL